MARTQRSQPARPSRLLAVTWLIAAGNVLAVLLLPRSMSKTYSEVLFGVAIGSLLVVVCYARLLTRPKPEGRSVVLVGGPCDGQLLLSATSQSPVELWLASDDGTISTYRASSTREVDAQVLRYQRPHPIRPIPLP